MRIQESGYRSESAQGVGSGAYSVVTARDIETEQDINTISKLHGVAGVVTLNRLLLPKPLSSDLDLREAAGKLQADAILIYTIATEFSDNEVDCTAHHSDARPRSKQPLQDQFNRLRHSHGHQDGLYLRRPWKKAIHARGLPSPGGAATPSRRRARRRNEPRTRNCSRASVHSGRASTPAFTGKQYFSSAVE